MCFKYVRFYLPIRAQYSWGVGDGVTSLSLPKKKENIKTQRTFLLCYRAVLLKLKRAQDSLGDLLTGTLSVSTSALRTSAQ